MSIHKSLKKGAGMGRQRNVYTRYERLMRLQDQGRWDETQSVYGMPKVRATVIKVGGKKKKKKGPEEKA